MYATQRTIRVQRRTAPARSGKWRTVRLIALTVLSTVLVLAVGLGVLGTVMPGQPAQPIKSTTIKFNS